MAGRRISLRLDRDFHSYLHELADDLGVGLNDLMNLLLRRAGGPFRVTDRGFQRSLGGKPRTLVTKRAYNAADIQRKAAPILLGEWDKEGSSAGNGATNPGQ